MDAQPLQESNPPAGVDRSAPASAGGDWRAQLRPEARSRIANRIHKALLKCLPVESSEAMDELKKISVRFEEKIYTAATSQPDYMRKISLKMLGMEMKTQPARANAQVNPNQYNPNQG